MPTFSVWEKGKRTKIVTSVPASESIQLPQPTEEEWMRFEEQVRHWFKPPKAYRIAHALGCARLDGLGCSCGAEPQEQR